MTVHTQIRDALAGLAGDRVFPIIAPEGEGAPYIVYQVVGGPAINFVGGEKPSKQMRRVQVSVWANGALEASSIAEQAEDALRATTTLQTEVLGVAADTYDELTKYKGTMQEFYLFC